MSTVKAWVAILCFSALASAMLELLIPLNKMENIVRLVLSAFMISAILIPFTKSKKSISLAIPDIKNNVEQTSQYVEFSNQELLKTASEKITTLASDVLAKENINYKKIEVFMDIKEDYSISIKRLEVTLNQSDSNKEQIVKSILNQKLGLEVVVNFI